MQERTYNTKRGHSIDVDDPKFGQVVSLEPTCAFPYVGRWRQRRSTQVLFCPFVADLFRTAKQTSNVKHLLAVQ